MVWFPVQTRGFFTVQCVHTGCGAYPPSYSMGIMGFFSGGKAAGGETGHSPPSSAKVKNERRYISTLLHSFMAGTETNLPVPLNKDESVAFCSSPGDNEQILPDSLARRVCNRAEGRSGYLPNTVVEQYHTAELSRRQQRKMTFVKLGEISVRQKKIMYPAISLK